MRVLVVSGLLNVCLRAICLLVVLKLLATRRSNVSPARLSPIEILFD